MKGTKYKICNEDSRVEIWNHSDWHYSAFETREEVDKFIKELIKARDEVFGKGVK